MNELAGGEKVFRVKEDGGEREEEEEEEREEEDEDVVKTKRERRDVRVGNTG